MVTDPTLSEFLAAHCGGTLDREAGAALAALAQDVSYHRPLEARRVLAAGAAPVAAVGT